MQPISIPAMLLVKMIKNREFLNQKYFAIIISDDKLQYSLFIGIIWTSYFRVQYLEKCFPMVRTLLKVIKQKFLPLGHEKDLAGCG